MKKNQEIKRIRDIQRMQEIEDMKARNDSQQETNEISDIDAFVAETHVHMT